MQSNIEINIEILERMKSALELGTIVLGGLLIDNISKIRANKLITSANNKKHTKWLQE